MLDEASGPLTAALRASSSSERYKPMLLVVMLARWPTCQTRRMACSFWACNLLTGSSFRFRLNVVELEGFRSGHADESMLVLSTG